MVRGRTEAYDRGEISCEGADPCFPHVGDCKVPWEPVEGMLPTETSSIRDPRHGFKRLMDNRVERWSDRAGWPAALTVAY